jgi:hypothetical protein
LQFANLALARAGAAMRALGGVPLLVHDLCAVRGYVTLRAEIKC